MSDPALEFNEDDVRAVIQSEVRRAPPWPRYGRFDNRFPPRIPELEDRLDRAGLGGIQDHGGALGIQSHPELGTKQGGRAGSDCRTHGLVPGLEATNHRAIDPDGTACSGLAEPSPDAKRSEVVRETRARTPQLAVSLEYRLTDDPPGRGARSRHG